MLRYRYITFTVLLRPSSFSTLNQFSSNNSFNHSSFFSHYANTPTPSIRSSAHSPEELVSR